MNQLPIFVTLRDRNVMLVGDGEAAEAKRMADEASIQAVVSEIKADIALDFIAPPAIETVAPAANVAPMVRPAASTATDINTTIRLGHINDLLVPYLQLSAANRNEFNVS